MTSPWLGKMDLSSCSCNNLLGKCHSHSLLLRFCFVPGVPAALRHVINEFLIWGVMVEVHSQLLVGFGKNRS